MYSLSKVSTFVSFHLTHFPQNYANLLDHKLSNDKTKIHFA